MTLRKISVRIPDEMVEFFDATGGGGHGARSDGVRKVAEFAQHTPRAFQAFLNGREFADIGEIIAIKEGDYVCPTCNEVVVQVASTCNEEEQCDANA